jgi:hypothetical protein
MSSHWLHRLLPLELLLIRRMSFLRKVPLLGRLHHQVTARLALLDEGRGGDLAFRLDFETPYLRLPVEVDRNQIRIGDTDSGFSPAAFRFFDWQSWAHIDGEIEWHGLREVTLNGERVTLITGFGYQPGNLPERIGNLGARIAEGVEGTVRALWGSAVVSVGFEPGYWMLEPGKDGYRVVPIRDNDLMVLIVSLSEIGSGNRAIYGRAIEHLWQWVSFRCGQAPTEAAMLMLLRYIRRWAPLGMEPLYGGLIEILDRLGVDNKERILFEYYADHWGVRDDKNGRLLAVRTLEALGTGASRSALREILAYVRNRGLEPGELALIQTAAGVSEPAAAKDTGKEGHSPVVPLHPAPAR